MCSLELLSLSLPRPLPFLLIPSIALIFSHIGNAFSIILPFFFLFISAHFGILLLLLYSIIFSATISAHIAPKSIQRLYGNSFERQQNEIEMKNGQKKNGARKLCRMHRICTAAAIVSYKSIKKTFVFCCYCDSLVVVFFFILCNIK